MLVFGFCAHAQSLDDYKQTQDQIHTIYLYNFSRYFVWPSTPQEEFVIGVMGQHSIAEEIKKMAEVKTVAGKPIIVKTYNSPQDVDPSCRIIFIPHENSFWLSEVLAVTRDKPVLVVSSKPGLGKFGSLLNFIAYQGKITFEINEDAIQNRQLKFAQQIKAIGRLL
uniref:YfiR family protein n=1 Tax=Roseihalotalea indica TaxID=2867963 RepID=A0AA49GL75_9BACT|nr:YfiR family protein [Tunicatimonas sp. TK19036]